jgi:hypothetical protein
MRRPLFILALATLAACGSSSDSGTGPGLGSALNGTYALKTVDNKQLPVAFADSTLKGGQLVMSDSGVVADLGRAVQGGGERGRVTPEAERLLGRPAGRT